MKKITMDQIGDSFRADALAEIARGLNSAPQFQQIDVVLCEDGKTVWLYGYETDETCWLQTFDLPAPIEEKELLADEWRAAAQPDRWRLFV